MKQNCHNIKTYYTANKWDLPLEYKIESTTYNKKYNAILT